MSDTGVCFAHESFQRVIVCQRGIPPLEWCVVILGGIVTVALTYFLVLEDLRIQVALTAMVAVVIALNIYLILMFGYPFAEIAGKVGTEAAMLLAGGAGNVFVRDLHEQDTIAMRMYPGKAPWLLTEAPEVGGGFRLSRVVMDSARAEWEQDRQDQQ